ncbi:MAG: ABC transporter permease [Bacteroidota bacterium]
MKHDLKFTFRRIFKNKLSTIINVFGLTVGIFVSIALINFYIQERTVDHYHTKADRTYKAISRVQFNKNASEIFSITFGTLAESIQFNFSEVEHTARLYGPSNVEVDLKTKRFNNIRLLQVDYAFFQIFDIPGINTAAFNTPNDAVVSRETAQKLFNGDAIGKQIEVENNSYTITAIADIPKGTVFKFDIALPLPSMPYFEEMVNGGLEFETYVTLKKGIDATRTIAALTDHHNQLIEKEWPDNEASCFFLPLKEVYLNDAGVNNRMGNGDPNQLTIVLTISLVVLILALINYVNLQVANNHTRTLELRLKKIMGAGRKMLVKQSVMESSFLLLISMTLAIGLLELFYASSLRFLFGKEVFTIHEWHWKGWIILLSIATAISLITGIIPSLKLFKRSGLTQQAIGDKRLGKFTIGLVIFQFLVTATLLTVILFVNKQMDFLEKQPKGYDSEQIIVIDNLSDEHNERYELIRSRLLQNSAIVHVGGAQSAPGNGGSGQSVFRINTPPEDGIDIAHIRTLKGYTSTLDLNFTKGGDFTITDPKGEKQFILNESAVDHLFDENEEVIGSVINMSGRIGEIVGVVEDFHFLSLKYQVSPLALNIEELYELTLLVKMQTEHVKTNLEYINQVLSSVDPLYVFDYQFLDDQFEELYQSEIRTKKIITYATIVAFSISVTGLLALSLFVINSKVKEIAIRKTLGGSQRHIFMKLSSKLIT